MRACCAVLLALVVTACAGGQFASSGSNPLPVDDLRDLSETEKKVIAAGVAVGMQGQRGQFRWAKFPKEPPADGVVQYCATVNAKPFIAAVTMANGRAASAQLVAIGGREGGYVDQECRRHYVTPFV